MNKYQEMMKRKNEIMLSSIGIDFDKYQQGVIAFDYEKYMKDVGYSLEEVREIQREVGVGNTPLIELKNISSLARKVSKTGKAARIFIKDESCNKAGSFKDRRAALAVYDAMKKGYKGVVSATSGNYGASVASQAATRGLKCVVVNECYDSRKIGQPEILEKGRKCEGYGAEVLRLTVGPELFYTFLKILEETGYYNASLYSSFAVAGIETLGYEIAEQCREELGRLPDAVVITNAGGGNATGTARGLIKAGASEVKLIGTSIDLSGLHMASDKDFNRKSFTTGHTGFGVPFMVNPDRSDVPRSAARPLRYLDRYVSITQGEVFWMTELLAQLEGLERGPAGNTSLAAAFALAQEYEDNHIIIVQETEYTGAGKHPLAQLSFAKENGIEVYVGDPKEQVPGKSIVIPAHPSQVSVVDFDMKAIRSSYIKNIVSQLKEKALEIVDIEYLKAELKASREEVLELLKPYDITIRENYRL